MSVDEMNGLLNAGSAEMDFWKKRVIADPGFLEILLKNVFGEDPKLAWRSCWILDTASEADPSIFSDKIPQIVNGLLTTNNPSLKRHFTRILCRYPVPDHLKGNLVDKCYILLSPSEPVAVRVFAMQLLFNLALEHPGLKDELVLVLESLLDEEVSAGFKNRGAKLLRKLRLYPH